MIADRIRFLDDVVLGGRLVAGAQREQKRPLRVDVAAFAVRLRPRHVGEAAADLAVRALRDDEDGRGAVADAMKCGRGEAVCRCAEEQPPVLLGRAVPPVERSLEMHFIVLQDGRADEHVHQEARLQPLVVFVHRESDR